MVPAATAGGSGDDSATSAEDATAKAAASTLPTMARCAGTARSHLPVRKPWWEMKTVRPGSGHDSRSLFMVLLGDKNDPGGMSVGTHVCFPGRR